MPFIFFGSRAVRERLHEGAFHCPRCGGPRRYALMRAQAHAHLYWVPLLRLGDPHHYVECRTCGTRFDAGVANRPAVPPVSEREALAQATLLAMRAVTRGSEPSRDELGVMRETLEAIGRGRVDAAALQGHAASGRASVALAAERLARIEPSLSPSARERAMEAIVRVATAGGPMRGARAEAVRQLAAALGVSSAHLKGIMVELAERRGAGSEAAGHGGR
jgi:hypothetical protein